jgi:capsular exopolysaccharide synthesis family protein
MTSPCAADGKTVSTLNLAISLAQDGYSVLVIDGDLRKGSCHYRLGLKSNGLCNILTGRLNLEEALQKTTLERLSLLSRGIPPPRPTDLLESPQMKRLLRQLRESFDFILIDSPPAVAVSDATVLSSLCDGIILVLNAKQTTWASARQALDRLGIMRMKLLGAVLNGVDMRSPEYEYYNSYYSYDSKSSRQNGAGGALSETTDSPNGPAESMVVKNTSEAQQIVTSARSFMDRLVHELTIAIGPIAPLIIREQIAALGATRETISANQFRTLVENVSGEIPDATAKHRFEKQMLEEIRAFHAV